MVRNREFDPQAALGQVVQLFTERGYRRTSMEDIVQATGVSRYGLYGTFGNKRELFAQALERYADDMGRQAFLRLLEPDAGLADIRRIFEERVLDACEGHGPRGCLLCQTAIEVAPHDDGLQEVLLRFLKRMAKTFAVGLENAQARGETRAGLDPKAGGDYLTGALFGLIMMQRAGFPRASLNAFVDGTMAAVAA